MSQHINFDLSNGQTSSVARVLHNDFRHSVVALKAKRGLKITLMHYACGISGYHNKLGLPHFFCLTGLYFQLYHGNLKPHYVFLNFTAKTQLVKLILIIKVT